MQSMEPGGAALGRRGTEARGVARAVEASLSVAIRVRECLETEATQR